MWGKLTSSYPANKQKSEGEPGFLPHPLSSAPRLCSQFKRLPSPCAQGHSQAGASLLPRRIFGNVWGLSGLLQLKGEKCCHTSHNAQESLDGRICWPRMSVVSRLRNLAFGLRVRGYEPGMAGIIARKCMPESSGGGEAKTGRERMEARVKVVVLIQFRTWIQLHLKPVNCDS